MPHLGKRNVYTPCFKKHQPSIIFFVWFSQKWTDFHNFWFTESWKQLTLVFIHLSATPEKCHCTTLWNAELFHRNKVIYFPPKLDNFEKQLAITLPRNLNFRQPLLKELLEVNYHLHWHTLLVFFDVDPSPCHASILAHVSAKSWCGWHRCYAYYAVLLPLVHIPDHSVNSHEIHSKKFWIHRKTNPTSGY